MRLVGIVLFAFVLGGCCPGFFPLLEDAKRVKAYEAVTPVDRDEGRKRVATWLSDPAAHGGPIGRSLDGKYWDVVESVPDGTVMARYSGYCASPPADPADDPWRLTFEIEARSEDRKMHVTFSRVALQWPTLGDNPSSLTHGHKRGPRSEQEMADITANCLAPIEKALVAAVGTGPAKP